MNNENVKWFSQTTLTFKDKQYSTDGYLRVALSSNTEDYKFFNPPLFNISITNQMSKICNLNIQNAEDLLESFTVALKQLNGDDTIIEKHYQKNSKIFFKFAVTSSTNERVVIIEIISSETDAVKIIVPIKPTFQSFLRRLRFYVDHYDDMCFGLLTETFKGESNNIIHQLPSLIKGISSQILSEDPDQGEIADTPPWIDQEVVKETAGNILDLDKFMGPDMENIKIPEIDEKKAEEKVPIVEIESDFINKVLKGDLFNLENKLTGFRVSSNAIRDLATDLETTLGFNLLNGITEDDEKSIIYISKLFQDFYSKTYTINGEPLPSATPTLKFKGKADPKNIEFAKDLIVIIGYMRTVRRRLESKIVNAYDNKSMVYLLLRCMMDPFCFSYLDGLTRNDILASIKNRYDYFDSIGVFDKYKQILIDNRCGKIDSRDISLFAEELVDKIVGKTPTIDLLHHQLFSSSNLRLPSKNTYNLEQITNEFVPVEVNEKLGADYKVEAVVTKTKEQLGVSEEIMQFFIGKQKVQKTKTEKITPLRRWVDKFKQDIPESYRDDVIKFVKDMQYGMFDFEKSQWPLEEFDERIIKALYVWDPNSDEKMKANFEYFATLVEDEAMTKESILISTKIEQSDGWSAISEFV